MLYTVPQSSQALGSLYWHPSFPCLTSPLLSCCFLGLSSKSLLVLESLSQILLQEKTKPEKDDSDTLDKKGNGHEENKLLTFLFIPPVHFGFLSSLQNFLSID